MATTRSIPTSKRAFGDFQTPLALAFSATQTLARLGVSPRSIIEPTCGRGAFLSAAAASFPDAETILGVDINADHLDAARAAADKSGARISLQQGNFFQLDWKNTITQARSPWLILGNPPWVTNAELGSIHSDNLPAKSNFHGRAGIEAITGKSNFDISEWMLHRYLDWLEGTSGAIAVLCKTAVARKVLLHIWKRGKNLLHSARIYKIDALQYFGASVDACFFVLEIGPEGHSQTCDIFENLASTLPSRTLGILNGHIVADLIALNQHRRLLGPEDRYIWRSGIKHDCSKIMELLKLSDGLQNGLGEVVSLEDDLLYPMLKSSDIANGRIHCRNRMLVTQRFAGGDTNWISVQAPRTWNYLTSHAALLNNRGSVIYKNKPAFSIFGVGPYSFSPWKVAISALYKKLQFVKIGPLDGKPVMFDDTINFLPCWSEAEADFLETLLDSKEAHAFFHSMIHWDEKRPITIEILKRLSLCKLAKSLGRELDYSHFTTQSDLPLFGQQESGLSA